MKFIAIKTAGGSFTGNISFYCKILHVTRQGFYKYLANKDRPWKYQDLANAMPDIHSEDEYNDTYGRVRMHQALILRHPEGINIPSERTIYRVVEKIGLSHRPNHKPHGITRRQLQLVEGIMKEDLYTAYYVVAEDEEIVGDKEIKIPGIEEDMLVERTTEAVVEPEIDVVVMNQPANSHNDGNGQEEQINVAGKQQIDLEGTEMSKVHNLSDENVARMDEGITDVTGKSELVEHEEKESVDEVGWIVRRISESGGYENVSDSVKVDIFGLNIADVGGNIRLFSEVMKRLEMSFMRSFREFMMRVSIEMLAKIKQKIRCGIGAEGDDYLYSFFMDNIMRA